MDFPAQAQSPPPSSPQGPTLTPEFYLFRIMCLWVSFLGGKINLFAAPVPPCHSLSYPASHWKSSVGGDLALERPTRPPAQASWKVVPRARSHWLGSPKEGASLIVPRRPLPSPPPKTRTRAAPQARPGARSRRQKRSRSRPARALPLAPRRAPGGTALPPRAPLGEMAEERPAPQPGGGAPPRPRPPGASQPGCQTHVPAVSRPEGRRPRAKLRGRELGTG